jgi:glucose/arabinose dehydrogenase
MRRAVSIALFSSLVLAACGGSSTPQARRPRATTTTEATTTTTTKPADLNAVRVTLTKIADGPRGTAMAVRKGDDALYFAQQSGQVVALRNGALSTVLDLSSRVTSGGEHGLLGIAFAPDGMHLYVHYSAATNGDTTLEEYAVAATGTIDPASRRLLLTAPDLQANHNGGELTFGPDGMLYLAIGDGGAAFDRGAGHAPNGNGQSLDVLNGKILRIDPSPTQIRQYTIPADNPFASGGGRPEIWAYGLRNPWRFSFDSETNDLWIADVGQNQWEEIDMVPFDSAAGKNFGWPYLEGTHTLRDGAPAGTTPPVLELSHDTGDCSITGGFVYRGTKIPDLVGAYVFSDYCNGTIRAIKVSGGQVVAQRDLGISSNDISSFGEDATGELYVISQSEGFLRIDPA